MAGTTEQADRQEFTFQAEIKQLLQILSQSLYQNREIALRELVSNASDALDKMRHLQLVDESHRDEQPLEIHIEPDKENRVLTIRDNGVGMTRDELVNDLGTIARSGSLEFLKQLSGDQNRDLSLIGQFGVGFYSSFMLADNVEVLSRSYKEDAGWRWESDGSGSFQIEPAEGLERGTQIRLHLKEDHADFTEPDLLKSVIRKYSTFVPHPVKLDGERINEERPIWVEPKSELSDDDYNRFYQYLSHRVDEQPLWYLHLSADSPLQFHAILYCPPTNFELLGFGRAEHGLHLCAKRVLVQDNCRELLPDYLRFLYGLVDSEDLPLNVARESLQDNTVFRKIRKVLVKRILDHLESLAGDKPDDYRAFYKQFGPVLREGISTDFENRERIAGLLRFPSSKADDPEQPTSLDEYLSRAREDQKQIYYISGPDLASLRKNPNLEMFHRNDLEVLYLTDPVDEVVLSNLHTYKDKTLASIDSADVELPESVEEQDKPDEESESEKEETSEAGVQKVLELFREALGDRVAEVRESKRLTDSPCCLVNPQGGVSAQLQKVLQMTQQDFQMQKRIFEVNPRAKLIKRLSSLAPNEQHHEFIRECGQQLYANALLLEGTAPDVQETVTRMQTFMDELAEKRSPIIT